MNNLNKNLFLISFSWLFLGNSCPVSNRKYTETCVKNPESLESFSCLKRSYTSVQPLNSICGNYNLQESSLSNCPEENLSFICNSTIDSSDVKFYFYSPITPSTGTLKCQELGATVQYPSDLQ